MSISWGAGPFPGLRAEPGLFFTTMSQKKRSVRLVTEKDIKGFFHVHTTDSDGLSSMEEIVRVTGQSGYRYVGITDHSQSAYYAGGLKAGDLVRQRKEVERLRKRYPRVTIFWGIESDILSDGALDYPPALLREFDFIIVSIHSRFDLSKKEQTRRIIKALKNPYATLLGHPTGRLLKSRPGYEVDMIQVIDAAADYGKGIEINSHPHRLDLDWRFCPYAREKGVLLAINPDAHSTGGIQTIPLGVAVARKGGLTKANILNTRSARDVARFFSQCRGGSE
ncbi:MAG: hypothetical protein A3B79_01160 [Deltaproteobacteria bacterium RIFCSPHIGHO2_02_FULL_50_15]|nr:MAG: hypothetical protein A3B79_01160 [Deltaproteobacteria bacterium RIFCSPHIGHO2_02_FULL_50_15]